MGQKKTIETKYKHISDLRHKRPNLKNSWPKSLNYVLLVPISWITIDSSGLEPVVGSSAPIKKFDPGNYFETQN